MRWFDLNNKTRVSLFTDWICILFTAQEKVAFVTWRPEGSSYIAIRAQFSRRFHHDGPADKTIRTLVNMFKRTGSLATEPVQGRSFISQWKDWSHQDIHWKESKIGESSVTMSLWLRSNSLKYNSGNSHENTYVLREIAPLMPSSGGIAKRCKIFSANQLSDLKTLKNLFSILYWSVFHELYQLNRISTRNISTVNIILYN